LGPFNDLSAQCAGPFDNCVKVVDLEPEHDAVSGRRRVRVYKVWVIVLVPGMELKNQLASTEQAVIEVAMAVVWQ
jgi:hypothetical protein